jgi:hypothetical protein
MVNFFKLCGIRIYEWLQHLKRHWMIYLFLALSMALLFYIITGKEKSKRESEQQRKAQMFGDAVADFALAMYHIIQYSESEPKAIQPQSKGVGTMSDEYFAHLKGEGGATLINNKKPEPEASPDIPEVVRAIDLGKDKCYRVRIGVGALATDKGEEMFVPNPKQYPPCNVLTGIGNMTIPLAFNYIDGKVMVLRNRTYISVPSIVEVVDVPPWWEQFEKWWKKNMAGK